VYRPQVSFNTFIGLPFWRVLQAIVEPNEIEGRTDPGDTRYNV